MSKLRLKIIGILSGTCILFSAASLTGCDNTSNNVMQNKLLTNCEFVGTESVATRANCYIELDIKDGNNNSVALRIDEKTKESLAELNNYKAANNMKLYLNIIYDTTTNMVVGVSTVES